jgi:hypothetical protein
MMGGYLYVILSSSGEALFRVQIDGADGGAGKFHTHYAGYLSAQRFAERDTGRNLRS